MPRQGIANEPTQGFRPRISADRLLVVLDLARNWPGGGLAVLEGDRRQPLSHPRHIFGS